MPGSFDLNPVPSQVANVALPIVVCLYDPAAQNPYTVLPNVRCLRIDYREGPEPPVARFQYLMDDLLQSAFGWPSQFEQLWPIDAQGDYVVLADDRLVVLTQDPNGNPIVLFDGFAQIPQVDLSARQQGVTFVAVGTAVRLWDSPIHTRVQRDASNATTTDGSADTKAPLPCRFNPADNSVGALGGYIGNCVAEGEYTDLSVGVYPVFLDPLVLERGINETSYWFVADALAYLIATQPSPEDESETKYVIYPTIASLQALLTCISTSPSNGTGTLNSSDAVDTDIQIRDYDATNKAVPEVFAELLQYCGFVMYFFQDQDPSGNPLTRLTFARRDSQSTQAPKLLYLDALGATEINLSANNSTSLHLARDCNQIQNDWHVETGLQQYEITVYLAPGFTPASGDEAAGNVTKWYSSNLTSATDKARRMYRWYIADECGDGHWNASEGEWITDDYLDFNQVFPPNPKTGNSQTVVRYRPGTKTLISKDASGKPLKATLELLQGQLNRDPELVTEEESGPWTTITKGWQLLDDRLGIEVTIENPEEWHTGQLKGTDAAVPVIRGVSWLADPDADKNQNVLLRLTTVVESDIRITAKAPKRIASPSQFSRRRSADGKDHFQYCAITPFSTYWATQKDAEGNPSDGKNALICRDDTAAATTHAEQLRSAHEFPTLAGSVTIPFITDYYGIADRVKILQGRGASFQVNVGVDQGETPSYPWITAFAWDFSGDRQQTVLQFSDRRAEPQGV